MLSDIMSIIRPVCEYYSRGNCIKCIVDILENSINP